MQNALTKIKILDIAKICPLHGPILDENIDLCIEKCNTWARYQPEDDGIVIAYTSIYGNTKKAVMRLADRLKAKGWQTVITLDLARTEWSEAVAAAFRYSKLVLATTTYSSDIFPYMRHFIYHLVERNFQNRTVGFIENGSWAPTANKIMKSLLDECKNITYLDTTCTIRSALNNDSTAQLDKMVDEICKLS